MPRARLVLASTSPRRAELLRSLSFTLSIVDPGVPEELLDGETPAEHALRLAQAKARAVASTLGTGDAIVLGADTVVALDGCVHGKPSDDEDARRTLRRLAGRTHEVRTAVHLVRTSPAREASTVALTRVELRAFDAATLDWYVATGEPRDKAGAYSIQGQGALLVRGIEGSWTNVVGLPLEALPELFASVGIDLLDLLPSNSPEGARP